MYKKTSRVAIAAATVLALSLGAAVQAAEPTMPPAGAHDGSDLHHWRGGGPLGVFKRLHDQLKLTPEQEQQFQAANATTRQNRDAMRRNHEQARSQFEAAQNQPILDLDALHAMQQNVARQNAQLREQTAKTWLAFYASLTDSQKTQVSTALKQQFAKLKARRDEMHARWKQHRHASKPVSASATVQ